MVRRNLMFITVDGVKCRATRLCSSGFDLLPFAYPASQPITVTSLVVILAMHIRGHHDKGVCALLVRYECRPTNKVGQVLTPVYFFVCVCAKA